MMCSRKIVVFVKNKLITIDTVIPILIEMKDKYNITSEIVVFDNLAHEAINNNIVLKDAIKYVGNELFITKGEKNKILRRLNVFISLSRLFVNFICGAKILHFGLLSSWPFAFFAHLFSKRVYQLQPVSYDFRYSVIMRRNGKAFVYPIGKNIVIFGKESGKHYYRSVLNKRKVFYFGETRTRPHWVKYIRDRGDYYFNLFHSNINFSNGSIVYILGAIDLYQHKKDLFYKTIHSLSLINHKIPILLKPHAYTEIETVQSAISKYKNMYLTFLHPSVLSTRSVVFICNNFSNTLADAHSFGVTTIEYSNESASGKSDLSLFPDNESIEPQFVDYYIDNDEVKFSQVLNKILLENHSPSTFNGKGGSNDELLVSLSTR